MSATFPDSTVRHGTHSGWSLHQRNGERPCDPCYQAKSAYDKRYKSATSRARRNRASAKAQGRAYRRLARLYPDLYAQFYQEEKAQALEDCEQHDEAASIRSALSAGDPENHHGGTRT